MPDSRRASIVVLYNHPKSEADFERYYAATHGPMVGQYASEIGIIDFIFTKFAPGPDGAAPAFYRQAVLWFDSAAARARGMASGAFGIVAGDLANFADGGVTVLLGEQTN